MIELDPTQPGATIECDRLVKIYRVGSTDITALAGLDLRVDPGERVGVIGPSGCGKSTLLNVVGGLTTPTSGTVTVDGENLSGASPEFLDQYRRNRVGFVWQDTSRNLISYLNARDNVALPMELAGRDGARKRAFGLLDLVGIADKAGQRPAELSGGQQQRVAIAIALANSPSLILADEPTGSLDGETAAEIYAVLADINEELGITIVIVSHDVNMASAVGRVVELRDGQSAVEHRGSQDDVRSVLLVDRVGRVRLPDWFRENLHSDERVEAVLEEDGIKLRPAEDDRERDR
jgi:ABC-type lipoprotein export system ATPase subunit